MPLYEYRCAYCDWSDDLDLPVEHEQPVCPKCGEAAVRVFTPMPAIWNTQNVD